MKIEAHSFISQNQPNFVILEERRGDLSLYPHSDQLPIIYTALEKELFGPISQIVSRVNRFSEDYWKIIRKFTVWKFCLFHNDTRPDKIRLCCLLDHERVAQLAVVQIITEHTLLGAVHQFRFYSKNGFFPEIHLSGKKIRFSKHVLDRFAERIKDLSFENLAAFLMNFYTSPIIGMRANHGPAIIISLNHTLMALTYIEKGDEFFFTTCLSSSEINSLEIAKPPVLLNLHYGMDYMRPKFRNWNPLDYIKNYKRMSERTRTRAPSGSPAPSSSWGESAKFVQPQLRAKGCTANTKLVFVDDIPSPAVILYDGDSSIPNYSDEFITQSWENMEFNVRTEPATG